jgi:hypothetical protein
MAAAIERQIARLELEIRRCRCLLYVAQSMRDLFRRRGVQDRPKVLLRDNEGQGYIVDGVTNDTLISASEWNAMKDASRQQFQL